MSTSNSHSSIWAAIKIHHRTSAASSPTQVWKRLHLTLDEKRLLEMHNKNQVMSDAVLIRIKKVPKRSNAVDMTLSLKTHWHRAIAKLVCKAKITQAPSTTTDRRGESAKVRLNRRFIVTRTMPRRCRSEHRSARIRRCCMIPT